MYQGNQLQNHLVVPNIKQAKLNKNCEFNKNYENTVMIATQIEHTLYQLK